MTPRTKQTDKVRGTVYWDPFVLNCGKKLAAREFRSFNAWLSVQVQKLWNEQVTKDSMR
jgi:hypothetical protein